MKKSFLKWSTCIAGMLLAFSLTSCVSESDETPEVPTGDGTLVININSTPVGATTRSTDLSSVTESTEKTVSNLVIGIFRPANDATNANAKVEIQTLSSLNHDLSANNLQSVTSIARESGSASLNVAAGDVVLAVCNVPADIVSDLEAAATSTAFREVAFSIDNALIFNNDDNAAYANSGTAEAPATLPMYGEGTIAAHASITGAFTADVTVRHMVAKVTLNQVKLETTDGSIQFTPTQVFLTRVPQKADFKFSDYSNWTYAFNTANTKYYQGEQDFGGSATDGTQYRDYLSTAALSGTTLSSANPNYGTKYVFYTMPSDNTTDATVTRLVVKGTWSDDGGANTTTVYYPIKLSTVSAIGVVGAASIQPNSHYKIDLVIKRAGSSDQATDLSSTNTAQANVSFSDWDNQNVTYGFEAVGGDPTPSYD